MAETKDPIAALDAKDIPTRAAGARDLAAAGTPEAIDRLLLAATTDRSPGVRLAAACAAADILSRHRLPPRSVEISPEKRADWLKVVAAVDPELNTGLFAVCGTLGTPEALQRMFAGLRDPRQDVRAGACVGLWRAIASAAYNGDAALEARVVATLSDTRIRVETRVEIVRICADAGYTSALELCRSLPDQATRLTSTAAEELVLRLEQPPNPHGAWVDIGLDATAVDPKARGQRVAVVLSPTDTVVTEEDGSLRRAPLETPWRLLHVRSGDVTGPALQMGTRTWWPADPEDLCAFGDRLIAASRYDLLDACDEVLAASSAGLRVRGVALLARGEAANALLALEAAVAGKKVPPDAWWYLADALALNGRGEEAAPYLEKYLAKAAKKAPFVEEARRRLGPLLEGQEQRGAERSEEPAGRS